MKFIGVEHTQHASALAELINTAYRGTSGPKRWTSEHGLIEGARISIGGIRDLILDRNVRVFAAFDEDDMPRCCIAITFDGSVAELGAFAVHPDEQGNGLGTLLLSFAEQYAAKRAQTLRVCVVNKSDTLLNFYVRRGYSFCEHNYPYPTHKLVGTPLVAGLALVVMEKPAPQFNSQ
ncbi:MAG TPA: GNAT family N-acetyltransferase [Cellvibrionaceae bacterium]|nr:GNAT family N-acetyltransferase [Cellvibrionaceae bacterium]